MIDGSLIRLSSHSSIQVTEYQFDQQTLKRQVELQQQSGFFYIRTKKFNLHPPKKPFSDPHGLGVNQGPWDRALW